MIDQTAFFSLSYGLYIVGATDGERRAACVANTFQQVTSSPLQVSVALNKENATTDVILDSGRFTVSCLAQDATMELIGTFGFHCSTDLDKFASCETGVDAAGVPFVAEQCVARFSVRVVQAVNLGTHILYIGEVEEAEKLCAGDPMTYAYYHLVKGGKTPPKASSYLPDAPERRRQPRQQPARATRRLRSPSTPGAARCAATSNTATSCPMTSPAPCAAWVPTCSSASSCKARERHKRAV